MDKNRVTVEINGSEYTVIGPEAEDYIYRVGVFVDRKIKEITRNFPTISTTDASVLAAINIADELLKLRDENAAMDERIANLIAQSETQPKESIEKVNHQKTGPGKPLGRSKSQTINHNNK